MGWTDKLGDAWDALNEDWVLDDMAQNTGSAIGAAYSATSDSFVGEAFGAVAKPFGRGLMDTAIALNYPLHNVKRGLSTGALMNDRADGIGLFDGDAWSEAWKRSDHISIGQLGSTSFRDQFGLGGGDLDKSAFEGEFLSATNDPYAGERLKKTQDFYYNTWSGRLSSGAVDVIVDFTADPLIFAGKAVVAAKAARALVKPGSAGAVIDASVPLASTRSAAATTRRVQRQSNVVRKLFYNTDELTASQMANLPEFKASGDAGALASMFEAANREFPTNIAARHQAKADLLGSVLGDTKSIQAIKDRSAQMAEQIQRFGEPPITTAAYQQYGSTDFGARMIAAWQVDDVAKVKKLVDEHGVELANLQRVSEAFGSSSRISSGPLERLGAAGRSEKIDGALSDRMTESIIPNGLGGLPTRIVVGLASTRVPGSVNLKDPSAGIADLSSVVNKMSHTSPAERRGIMDAFVRAPTEDARREIIQVVETKIFADAASKYGMTPEAAKNFVEHAQQRRQSYTDALKTALYSTADTEDVVHFIDPEDGLRHVYKKAFLQTHIEDNKFITDPRVVDKFLKAGTNRRMLERWAEGTNLKGAATSAQNLGAATRDSLDNFGTMATRAWKDAALMRLAYPVRIQVDTQLRVMAHIGMMKWFMDGKFTAMGRHILSDKDGQYSLKNFFKAGDYNTSLAPQLKKGKLVGGKNQVPTNPAMNNEDVQRITASIISTGGASADLGNDIAASTLRQMRADGSYGKVKWDDPDWFPAFKRAIDQIRTSPTARKALEEDDIDTLKAIVLADPRMNREWLNFKKASDSIEEWLARIINHNNHLLPTTELRSSIHNPSAMRGMFDYEARAARVAVGTKAEAKAAEGKMATADYNDLVRMKDVEGRGLRDEYRTARTSRAARKKQLQAEFKAAPARSAERRAIRAEIRTLDPKPAGAAHKARQGQIQGERQTLEVQREMARIHRGDADAVAAENLRPRRTGELPPSGRPEPMDVHGESLSPLTRNKWAERWEDFRNGWYSWAADAPETVMGRSPIYVDAFQRYVTDAVARLGDEGVDLVGVNAIRRSADLAARKDVARVLFDATHTSNLAHGMRFLSPFFSAWEDTMKKWGKLMTNDPTLAPTFAKVWGSPNNLGIVQDSDGNVLKNGEKATDGRGEWMVIPKIKGLERIIPGNKPSPGKDAGMFRMRKDGLNILFQGDPPFLPGMGPLVQVPANELVRRHFVTEAENPLIKYILPFGVTDDKIPYQILPSWMKQMVDSGVGPFGTTKDFNQQYVLLHNQEQGAYQRGERKTEPTDKEIGNKTKQWFLLRAALNNASPISIQPVPKDQFYIDKAHQYFSDPERKGHWQEDFYDDFPGYFEMSTTLSVNETGLNATNDAYDAAKKHAKPISKNPELGWFFAGNDNLTGEWNANINTYQRSTEAARGTNFRSLKDPMRAIDDAQEAKGWIEYNKAATYIDLELEKRGLRSIQQTGAEDLARAKRIFVQSLMDSNRPFALAMNFGSADARRADLVKVAKEMWAKDKSFAAKPEQVLLKQYLEARVAVQSILATRQTSTLKSEENEDLRTAWDVYTSELRRSNLAFEQIFNRVLESDDLSQVF